MGWGVVGRGGVGLGAGTVAGSVPDMEGAEDAGDAERRGEDDVDGTAGVNDVGRGAGRDGRS